MPERERRNSKAGSSLMSFRIRNILLVCNSYDAYLLEEDGRIDGQIAREYYELSLSNPPSITRADSTVEALEMVKNGERFDLIITMYNVGKEDVFDFARTLKTIAPETPIVLLTSYSREVYRQIQERDRSGIDFVFCWNNSTDLIIAIIKLLEDKANADVDILSSGVQAILLVEDSVRYYSTYLPLLYKLVLQQNIESLKDALNENQQIQRKRARPKILLATNYNDAVRLYNRYKNNMLGVISDIGFIVNSGDNPNEEKLDAGIDLCNLVRKDNPKMPFLLQSSQESMREVAEQLNVGFVMKTSKTLTHDISKHIGKEFGFGDFIVKDPETGEELARASDLHSLEKLIESISDSALNNIFGYNYVSKWMFARGILSVGQRLRPLNLRDDPNARKIIIDSIHEYRINQGLGVVAKFSESTFNDAIRFAKLGEGSLGGKARGLAFLNHILLKHKFYDRWEGVRILVPRTFVITTDYFDTFILENGLQYVINSDISDAEILSEFVASTLPRELTEALKVFLHYVHRPLAVRSSSKLEDSYYQPFAGVYSTYMIPNTENEDQMLRLVSKAIKSVYASVYFASSRSYITATANVISEEKMAIVLQEMCGSEDQGYYFPTISGVARSLNFYPLGYEQPDEGIVKIAFGLGKSVVDGDQVLRFSPEYPQNVLQTSTPDLTMRDTQKEMYALNLQPDKFKTSIDDGINLEKIKISDCTKFRNLKYVVSTWDHENMRIVDSPVPNGPKFVTFAHILKYETFPLAEIVKELMKVTQAEMQCDVELEFAVNMDTPDDKPKIFNVLQVRPISVDSRKTSVNWNEIDDSDAIIRSTSALGTGWIEDVRDIIYLKQSAFDITKTVKMASELSALNNWMRSEKRGYVLIGYGRWGSSIPSLGVPVKWGDISETKALIECSLEHFRVDPSQGTHFFQNMTSFNVGYINVDPYSRNDLFDINVLDALPPVKETEFIRVIRFEHPLRICIDGKENRAMIKI